MKKTIIDLFESSVAKFGEKPFLLEKSASEFEPTTYAETREIALKTGAGLVALGIKPKQTVSILAEGCNAWITSELGLLYAGAISVPLSIKLEEANDLLFRLRHAEVCAIFVSRNQLPKIRRIREQLPLIKHVIVWGDIELDPLLINGNSKLKIYITYDLIKGIGRLMVTGNEYPHRVFFNGSANVGVDINLSQIYKDALGYEAATTSGIFGSVAAGATVGMSTNPVADLAKGLSFASSSVQDMTRLNYPVVKGIGDSGSFLAMFDSYNLYMISKFNYIVDENNTELGRPLCAVRQISNLSGYILCQGADCQIPGTQEEAIKINQYMNTGFFYE